MTSLEAQMAALSERIDALNARLDREEAYKLRSADRVDQEHKELAERVSALERSKAYLVGSGVAGGAILGWAGNLILSLLL